MVTVAKGLGSAEHGKAFETMFEDRKRLFVDLLGWSVPVVDGRYERDRFDDEHATYLIELDKAGSHSGSIRLLPTCRDHILGNLFPSLCDEEVPRAPAIFEITRLCLPARFPAAERLMTRNGLISAMIDHSLSHGITELTGVVQDAFLKQILGMGWEAKSLGSPKRIGGSLLGAFSIRIDEETPERLLSTGIYRPDSIFFPSGQAA
jgi:acyl-homoserine lactone synthase